MSEVDFGDRIGHCGYSAQIRSECFGYFEQYPGDLDLFFLAQTDHLIVLIDDRERLDKRRLAAGRKPMHYTRHLTPRISTYGNYKSAVANGDDVFLDGRGCPLVHQGFEIPIDSPASLVEFPADPAQHRAGAVVDLSGGQYFASYR